MKKYEKHLRKESASSVTNSNASYRKASIDILTDSHLRTHSAYNNHQSQSQNVNNNIARRTEHDDDEKHIYYEKLWPKTNNLRKKVVKSTKAPETGLTALASFPVSSVFEL